LTDQSVRKERRQLIYDEGRKKEKREQIIQAAAKVFARKGFAGTLIADMALEAGIGKGTIYEYFDSKEDLFFAVFEWFVQQSSAEAKIGISVLGKSASERLWALSEALLCYWFERRDLFTLTMEFWSASASSQMRQRFKSAFREAYQDFRSVVAGLLQEGIHRGEFRPEVEVESVAAALVGTWDALLLQAWFDEGFDPISTARSFWIALNTGLACQDSGLEARPPEEVTL
jgi:AcrR family transcriptional regulator